MMAPKETIKLPVDQKPPRGQGWTPKTQISTPKGERIVYERTIPSGHSGKPPKRNT